MKVLSKYPAVWCEFTDCGWSGRQDDNCVYVLDRSRLTELGAKGGNRVFLFMEDSADGQEVIEETYFGGHPGLKAEGDKSWDAMQRALTDGQLSWDGGEYPLNHTVLAGELLYAESDYIMSLKTPEQVRDIAAALPAITEEDFRYMRDWFQGIRDLYTRAAKEGRFVLFTADQ